MIHPSALENLFSPQSIAIVGVSHDHHAVGTTIYNNIVENGYKGKIFPVNPFLPDFQGKKVYASVLTIQESIDLAIVVVPSAVVPSVLEEIGKKGIPIAVVISSGFSEIGSKGTALEKEILHIGETYSFSILGPNCLGFIHTNNHLNASFARTAPVPGTIALLSQSGALGSALLDITSPKGIGLSHFISLGNKADITELDILEYLLSDPTTSVIGMYVEQMNDANRCIAIGKKIASMDNPKPVIVLKGGKTKEGNEAVRSHTGSLAGIPETYTALFLQSMMIETTSTQEFINTLVSFSQNPLPKGNNCAIITNAGGPAILATDFLVSSHISIPPLANLHNPIDLLGDAKASDYKKTLAFCEQESAVDSMLCIVTPQSVTEIADTANEFCMHKTTTTKPLSVCWMGEGVMKEGKQLLDMGKIPVSKYPEQAALMLANLHAFTALKTKRSQPAYDDIAQTQSLSRTIDVDDPLSILTAYGIRVPQYCIVHDLHTLQTSLAPLGDSIAIKILSPDIIHKSDIGAVQLQVPKKDAESVIQTMTTHILRSFPKTRIDGYLLMDMVSIKEGIEYIIGIKKIEGLGVVIMLGLGGIYVEVLKDVSFRFAPLSYGDAEDLVQELKSSILLKGVRGNQALDTQALIQTLLSVSTLAVNHPDIQQLDINPLLVLPKNQGVVALDCRLTRGN